MLRKQCLLVIKDLTYNYLVLGDKRGQGVVKARDIGSLVYCYAQMKKVAQELMKTAEQQDIKKAISGLTGKDHVA